MPENIPLQLKATDFLSTEAIYNQLGHPIIDEVYEVSIRRTDVFALEGLVASAFICFPDYDHLRSKSYTWISPKASLNSLLHLTASGHPRHIILPN